MITVRGTSANGQDSSGPLKGQLSLYYTNSMSLLATFMINNFNLAFTG